MHVTERIQSQITRTHIWCYCCGDQFLFFSLSVFSTLARYLFRLIFLFISLCLPSMCNARCPYLIMFFFYIEFTAISHLQPILIEARLIYFLLTREFYWFSVCSSTFIIPNEAVTTFNSHCKPILFFSWLI